MAGGEEGGKEGEKEEGSDERRRDGASPFSFLHQITSEFTDSSQRDETKKTVTRTHQETDKSSTASEVEGTRHTSAASTSLSPTSLTHTQKDAKESTTLEATKHPGSIFPPGVLRMSSPPTATIISPSPPPTSSGHAVAPGPVIPTSRPTKPASPHRPIGKQLPPTGVKKKKKRTAFRPGQEVTEIPLSTPEGLGVRDPDSLSVSSQSSSFDGGKDSVSIGSSSSELHKLVADELIKVDVLEAASGPPPISPSLPPELHVSSKKSDEQGPSRVPTSGSPVKRKELTPPLLSPGKGVAVSGKSTVEATGELVDISSEKGKPAAQARESLGVTPGDREGEGEKEKTIRSKASPVQELLAEVFTEPAKGGESPKEREVDEKGERGSETDGQGANYEVELTPADRLAALLQSSDSNLGSVR